MADDDVGHDEQLTNADWGKIHALAWKNDEVVETRDAEGGVVLRSFREALEMDPTSAILYYAREKRRLTSDQLKRLKIVKLPPGPCDIDEEFWEDVNPFPPSCC